MLRQIIKIDENKCNGCSLCVSACHEGAIGMENGKAKLLRDDYCDGLGNCLPVCPTGAISFEERDTLEYNEKEVSANMNKKASEKLIHNGCPGMQTKIFNKQPQVVEAPIAAPASRLSQWPIQIKLVPVNAPYFENADVLIAADCSAYAYGNFHQDFIKNKITLIGCPKLDEGDYAEKLAAILSSNNLKSLTIVRMEVPCCGGIVNAVKRALEISGAIIPWQVITISTDGKILN